MTYRAHSTFSHHIPDSKRSKEALGKEEELVGCKQRPQRWPGKELMHKINHSSPCIDLSEARPGEVPGWYLTWNPEFSTSCICTKILAIFQEMACFLKTNLNTQLPKSSHFKSSKLVKSVKSHWVGFYIGFYCQVKLCSMKRGSFLVIQADSQAIWF